MNFSCFYFQYLWKVRKACESVSNTLVMIVNIQNVAFSIEIFSTFQMLMCHHHSRTRILIIIKIWIRNHFKWITDAKKLRKQFFNLKDFTSSFVFQTSLQFLMFSIKFIVNYRAEIRAVVVSDLENSFLFETNIFSCRKIR